MAASCVPSRRNQCHSITIRQQMARIHVFLIDGARLHDEQALLRLETALFEDLRL